MLYTTVANSSMFLLDGLTGAVCDSYEFGCVVEATPIVYGNRVVIGTKGEQILGIALE